MIAARSKGGMTCFMPARDFRLARPRPAMQVGEQLGRGLVALGDRRAVLVEESLGAQVLDEQEAVVEILRKYFRHAKPCACSRWSIATNAATERAVWAISA